MLGRLFLRAPNPARAASAYSYPPDRSRGLIPTLPLPRLVIREAEPVVSGVEQPAAEARHRKFVDSLLEGDGFELSVPPRYGRWFSLEFSGSTPSPRNPTSTPATFRCCIPVCVSVRPSGFPRRDGSPPKISCGRYVGRAGRRPRIAARHEFDAGRHPVPAQSHNPTRPLGL